jgi:hypothetical protein
MREGKFDISPNVERIMRKTLGKKTPLSHWLEKVKQNWRSYSVRTAGADS